LTGQPVLASRLGYRISTRFMHAFLGKIFDDPMQVFDEAMLRPETQEMAAFVDGVNHIVEAHEKVAKGYLADGSIEDACPPLKALLHIMAEGKFDGKDLSHPDIRRLFSKEACSPATGTSSV
jgi:phosphoenolpyruvate carboxykinase (diphosphate)